MKHSVQVLNTPTKIPMKDMPVGSFALVEDYDSYLTDDRTVTVYRATEDLVVTLGVVDQWRDASNNDRLVSPIPAGSVITITVGAAE